MKKIIAIAILLLGVNIAHGASWAEMFQQAVTGQPAAVATTPAPSVAAPATTAVASNQLNIDQIKNTIPSVVQGIKLIVAKFNDVTAASQTGFWAGLKSAFSIDQATANAFSNLSTQAVSVVTAARSVLATADPATKSMVQGLVAQAVNIPEFQKLLEYAQSMPFVGGKLTDALNGLKQVAGQ